MSQVKDSGHRTVKVKNFIVCTKCGRKTAWRDASGVARDKAIEFWTTTQCDPTTTQVSFARLGVHKPDRRTLGSDFVEDCVDDPLVHSGASVEAAVPVRATVHEPADPDFETME